MTWGFDLTRRPAWHAAWGAMLLVGVLHLTGWTMGVCYGKMRGTECVGLHMDVPTSRALGTMLVAAGLVAAFLALRASRRPS